MLAFGASLINGNKTVSIQIPQEQKRKHGQATSRCGFSEVSMVT